MCLFVMRNHLPYRIAVPVAMTVKGFLLRKRRNAERISAPNHQSGSKREETKKSNRDQSGSRSRDGEEIGGAGQEPTATGLLPDFLIAVARAPKTRVFFPLRERSPGGEAQPSASRPKGKERFPPIPSASENLNDPASFKVDGIGPWYVRGCHASKLLDAKSPLKTSGVIQSSCEHSFVSINTTQSPLKTCQLTCTLNIILLGNLLFADT